MCSGEPLRELRAGTSAAAKTLQVRLLLHLHQYSEQKLPHRDSDLFEMGFQRDAPGVE
jgi:hypothetical protein